jgi:hypothetical protein
MAEFGRSTKRQGFADPVLVATILLNPVLPLPD